MNVNIAGYDGEIGVRCLRVFWPRVRVGCSERRIASIGLLGKGF